MTETQNNVTTTRPRQREAYERMQSEMAAVPESDYVTINVDVMTAVSTVLGCVPQILALRPKFEAELPAFDQQQLDKLETYALGTMHAQSQYLAASTPPENIPVLVAEAIEIRDRFIADVSALGKHGYINAAKLYDLKGTNGYRNTATDVMTLANLVRNNWDKVAGKTSLTEADLDYAETLGERIISAVGFRDRAPAIVAETAVARQQAFTVCVHAYDYARKGVNYLRWEEGDADDIAPSLYSGRVTKKRPTSDMKQKPEAPVVPAAPTAAVVEPTATPVAVGLPGASPFLK
jgi:hypothetical protein